MSEWVHVVEGGAQREDRMVNVSQPFVLERSTGSGGRYQTITGRAVPWDEWAVVQDMRGLEFAYLEAHHPTSLTRTTRDGGGKNAPLLLFHDNRKLPIGHAVHWDRGKEGLDGVWRLNNTPEAQMAAEIVDGGDLRGLSIGFIPKRWDKFILANDEHNPALGPDHMDRVLRTESRLVEVSLTPTPAYEQAQVALVRSAFRRDVDDPDGEHPALDEWRRVRDALDTVVAR